MYLHRYYVDHLHRLYIVRKYQYKLGKVKSELFDILLRFEDFIKRI